MEFLLASANFPFTLALTVMLLLAVIEGVGLVIGLGLSHVFDSLFPDWDLHIHHDVDVEAHGPFSHFLTWLRIRQVPLLVVLIVFLTYFGLVGLLIQGLLQSMIGITLHAALASLVVLILILPLIRVSIAGIAYLLPKDETSVVKRESFVGKVAEITLGTAKKGSPAQAKLKDKYAKTHYVMVEPDKEGDEIKQGDKVLLVKSEGAVFLGITDFPDTLEK